MKTRPYLIQRLLAPRNPTPFDFGGGLLNGGINREALAIISKLFSFDYMGAAEFEWGAVPTALQAIVDNKKDMTTFEDNKVFIICPKTIKEEVIEWIDKARTTELLDTKERVGLSHALNKGTESRTKGWLKIEKDNRCKEPFMFFIDKKIYNNTKKLLLDE